jgi:hypothetical protein
MLLEQQQQQHEQQEEQHEDEDDEYQDILLGALGLHRYFSNCWCALSLHIVGVHGCIALRRCSASVKHSRLVQI